MNKYTKENIINTINSLSPSLVVDIGCGENIFKGYIDNLIGIDKESLNADIQNDIFDMNFDNNSIDAIIAFGIFNFIPYYETEILIKRIYNWLKPNGLLYIKVRMCASNLYKEKHKRMQIYPWSYQFRQYLMDNYMFKYYLYPEIHSFIKGSDLHREVFAWIKY